MAKLYQVTARKTKSFAVKAGTLKSARKKAAQKIGKKLLGTVTPIKGARVKPRKRRRRKKGMFDFL